MTECRHKVLVLVPHEGSKLRCRSCHLTISKDELGGSYCPECYAERGVRSYDFEEVEATSSKKTRYLCDECNLVIESDL